MRFAGFVGPSYTARSTNVADEECINFYPETMESAEQQASTGARVNYFGTPGLTAFIDFGDEAPTRGGIEINGRAFEVSGTQFYEIFADGTTAVRGTVENDARPASLAKTPTQILIVAFGHAYCFTLADNTFVEVTSSLVGTPIQVVASDTYFIVALANSNKFQISSQLDGTTWPGLQVNAVSVAPGNITSIAMLHRELWVMLGRYAQPYQDTGSDNVFDVIPGTLLEKGSAATFGPALLDNTLFWIEEDERGARTAQRASGYTPQRISTHAVELDLQSYDDISGLVSYSLQVQGHHWWVLYIPGASWNWVYDVGEGMWFKLAHWEGSDGPYTAHRSWNHIYAFGKHLVGDWNSGKLYALDFNAYTDDGTTIRRLRRSPTVESELDRLFHAELRVDLDTGNGPQPPLTDGAGNPRAPQAMLRWSNDGGKTWSNEHWRPTGFAGEYGTFVRWQRLGYGRRRVYEFVVTDPVFWAINDAYLRLAS